MVRIARVFTVAVFTFILIGATACTKSPQQQNSDGVYLPSGSLLISKAIPEVSQSSASQSLLGFIPVIPSLDVKGSWISIDSSTKTVSLMNGDAVARTFSAQVGELPKGEFQLLHKQRAPLWYAPDSYFAARRLNVPAQGDRSRFRRGALGEYALFINKDTPIHSGPVWLDEIGGIRISDAEMMQLYPIFEIGDRVVIK